MNAEINKLILIELWQLFNDNYEQIFQTLINKGYSEKDAKRQLYLKDQEFAYLTADEEIFN